VNQGVLPLGCLVRASRRHQGAGEKTGMLEAEFDKFADEYRAIHAGNIRLSGESPDYFAEYKVRDVARALADILPGRDSPLEIPDFGGGTGNSLPYFRKHFPAARVTCADVSRKSLAVAAARFPELGEFVHFDGGGMLPFADASFDVAFAACVFHHIEHREHVPLFRELRRVLRPGGTLFVFEHNPLNPLTVRAVRTCEFDANARLIGGGEMVRRLAQAGFSRLGLKYCVFFPRALAALRRLERLLTTVPFGAQYYVMAEKR
jgi:ubiquinone/menaquinone biosynthesis C-methylase UbiE